MLLTWARLLYFSNVQQLPDECSSSGKGELDDAICRERYLERRGSEFFFCVVPLTGFGLHGFPSWLLLSRRIWRRVVRQLWDKDEATLSRARLWQSGVQDWCTKWLHSRSGLAVRYQHAPLHKQQTHCWDKCSFQLWWDVSFVFYVTIYDCYSILKESLPWKLQGGILLKIHNTLFK